MVIVDIFFEHEQKIESLTKIILNSAAYYLLPLPYLYPRNVTWIGLFPAIDISCGKSFTSNSKNLIPGNLEKVKKMAKPKQPHKK